MCQGIQTYLISKVYLSLSHLYLPFRGDNYPPSIAMLQDDWTMVSPYIFYCYLHVYMNIYIIYIYTVYPKKYAHSFVVLCFVVVTQSFIMNSHEVFIHIHQGCFAGTGAIVRLPQCQWSKPDGYGKTSQCITTTKRSKAKTVCIFIGIYFMRYDLSFIRLKEMRAPFYEHRYYQWPQWPKGDNQY